ncbi:MAG: AbrB/MazE/SpoVT family DNA-binding domain-containing protein [Ilumatobacteraceae bacterium]
MSRTTFRSKGQLTLPEEIRSAARLEEGDLFDAEITADGILVRPQKLIDATQAWFWESAWRGGEREADDDQRAGRMASSSPWNSSLTICNTTEDSARDFV